MRRTAGAHGAVSVRVRSVGGGEPWDGQVAILPLSEQQNTISEALSNRDERRAADAIADYNVSNKISTHSLPDFLLPLLS